MEKNLGHATAYGYAKSKGYSGTEDEFAQLMADYASVGQSAAQSAEQAAASATSASGSAATAASAAQTATSKASEAVTAAGTATTKASEASQSASTASAAATSASTSAQTATTAASTATTKASEASESATTASAAKTDAETARDAAAQSASEAAESAKAVRDEISDLKEDLETNFHINGNVKPNLVVGSFVNATNNHIDQGNNFSMTEPIAVKKGQKVTLTARGYNAVVGMIATCNADNTSRTTVVKSIDSSEHDYIYNVPEDGYIVCSFDNRHEYKIAISIDYYSLFEDMDTLNIINAGTDSVPIVVKSTGFINATNNKYAESNNFYLSESVHLYKDQTVSLTATGYNTVVGMINLYDSESDAYETVVASTDSSEHTYSYTATKECDVRFSYEKYKSATASITTSETTSVRLDSIESDIADLQNSISAPVEYPQLFTNVICIGDSLTYGHDGQTRLETNYPFYFGKLANVTVSNQGLSGRTTKQWWDELGSTYTHFADFDCAIIYLGTNGGLTDTIETDCNTSDYTQNADTNTGCYGKIIGKIKADAPNCKIFCVAGPSEYLNRDSTMNPAVRHLASFYDVGLIDLSGCMIDDNGITSSVERYLYRPIDGIHYNRLGYMTLANMIYDYMKVYIKNHLSKYVS